MLTWLLSLSSHVPGEVESLRMKLSLTQFSIVDPEASVKIKTGRTSRERGAEATEFQVLRRLRLLRSCNSCHLRDRPPVHRTRRDIHSCVESGEENPVATTMIDSPESDSSTAVLSFEHVR